MGLYRAAEELGCKVEIVAAYDSWEPAVRVYNANLHPVARVCDLKQLDALPECDLVIGGPPCQDHSMAGKRACKCNVGGPATERCCLRDFVRLAGDRPYIMENVVSRLINAPYSVKLCAADFGDVTSRKRWWYSNYLLHVIPTPGPRRIRDIRDHAEDERVLKKRRGCKGSGKGTHEHFEHFEHFSSLTAHAWHGHDIRNGKLLPIGSKAICGEAGVFGSLTRTNYHGSKNDGYGQPTKGVYLRLGLRGNSASASASAFEDDEVLGSVLSNSFHANEASRIVACRNPSLLEMQRAHSFPDTWDWAGCNKSQRGQMIANSWPVGLGTAVCKSMLSAILAERNRAA